MSTAADMPAVTANRRPGRPRHADIDDRVLSAVIALIDDETPVTVNRVVEASGVSRAAVYRRWPTISRLTAAALDRGRGAIELSDDMPLPEALAHAYPPNVAAFHDGYPEERLRQRLRLALGDRVLQREYWDAHVSRRRAPVAAALRRGVARGEVRPDADIEAALDLLSGAFYYQLVARGASLLDPETQRRCAAAVDIVWRGLAAVEPPRAPGKVRRR